MNYISYLILNFINIFIFWSFRESEDTALLLLKEIYDKQGVTFEQPQQ